MKTFNGDFGKLAEKIICLRGEKSKSPEASIIIPVNAQGDLLNVLNIIYDISQYSKTRKFEIILVINNYSEEQPPEEIETYSNLGVKVISIPKLRKRGEAIGFTARIPGLKAAESENTIFFDADCRILNATKLIEWYINKYNNGVEVAYSHVDYYDVRDNSSVKARIIAHHLLRWVKRVIFRIPTVRGSNYAINRSLILDLYNKGFLADDMNVGPAAKAAGANISYSGNNDLLVLTSGRMFSGGWLKLVKYLIYRLKYNLRVIPVRKNAANFTRRNNDSDREYVNNRLVRQDNQNESD